jgi:hypothetical protein
MFAWSNPALQRVHPERVPTVGAISEIRCGAFLWESFGQAGIFLPNVKRKLPSLSLQRTFYGQTATVLVYLGLRREFGTPKTHGLGFMDQSGKFLRRGTSGSQHLVNRRLSWGVGLWQPDRSRIDQTLELQI